jgi:hypothetical protein
MGVARRCRPYQHPRDGAGRQAGDEVRPSSAARAGWTRDADCCPDERYRALQDDSWRRIPTRVAGRGFNKRPVALPRSPGAPRTSSPQAARSAPVAPACPRSGDRASAEALPLTVSRRGALPPQGKVNVVAAGASSSSALRCPTMVAFSCGRQREARSADRRRPAAATPAGQRSSAHYRGFSRPWNTPALASTTTRS